MQPRIMRLEAKILPIHQKVFECLLQVNKEKELHTTLRVAGGWVRDTLLGLHSNDIDIAIESPVDSPVSGEQFAKEVSVFQGLHGERERTVSVIRINPELSKHIETATVNVFDLPVEFCALRTDDYCEDSRIPQIRAASPDEDAKRRDFTINALFFNLHTGMVEDYTSGLADLENRVIRCPLEPRRTFMDDPLRLLRGIRFVGQLGNLGFAIDPSIQDCVDETILTALLHKVSRERIGKEFFKMLSGPRPEKCLDLLFEMEIMRRILLVEVYLTPTKKKSGNTPEIEKHIFLLENFESDSQRTILNCASLLSHLLDEFGNFDSEKRLLAVLFSLVIPFYRGIPPDQARERVYALCVNGLKLPTTVFNAIQRMIMSYNELVNHNIQTEAFQGDTLSNDTKLSLFDALGPLHDHCVPSEFIKIVLLVYLLYEKEVDIVNRRDYDSCRHLAVTVWDKVFAYPSLTGAYDIVLPIKGNELKNFINIEPKAIGPTLLELRKEMMLNPSLGRDEIIGWLQSNFGAK